jgi:outer membrane protein
MGDRVLRTVSTAACFVVLSVLNAAQAQGIDQALTQAYRYNPDLNAARAGVRVANEGVPSALSGYRPSLSASLSQGYTYNETRSGGVWRASRFAGRSASVTGTQTLWDANRTANTVRQADQNVMVARETLRNAEITTLLASATAYMNVLREQAVLDLRLRNVAVLQEQLRATRDRFGVGEVTRTDVALAESALQGAIATVAAARSDLANSRAVFRQQIGQEPPARLAASRTVERLLSATLNEAIVVGQSEHPQIRGARHGAESAQLQVRIAESALYPTVTLQGTLTRSAETSALIPQNFSASASAVLTVPIYANGGRDYATIRQADETAAQQRIRVETAQAAVRQAVVQSWAGLEAARAQIQAAEAQVRAAEIALNGAREEAKVGQRTTLDVLNATQTLTEARVTLVRAQRDRVVLSYSVLAAMGRLNAQRLALRTEIFDPTVHYNQVRDQWIGIRTPDGR